MSPSSSSTWSSVLTHDIFTLSLIQINHYCKMQILPNYLKDLGVSVTYKWSTWSKAMLLKVSLRASNISTWELVRRGKLVTSWESAESGSSFWNKIPRQIHTMKFESSDLKHQKFKKCFTVYLWNPSSKHFCDIRSSSPLNFLFFLLLLTVSMKS